LTWLLNAQLVNFIRLICFYKIFGGLHIFFTVDSCKITEAKRAAHLHDGLQWKFASARAALAAKSVSAASAALQKPWLWHSQPNG
jgi:hypothetical protein